MTVRLIHGDCREVLPTLPAESVDSCVCDPPYHLQSIHKRFAKVGRDDKTWSRSGPHQRTASGFMGQQWDGGDVAFRPETWAEVLRVLKPGAHLVAFSGTRTYHRMVCAIEDAGFEIRDQLAWLYGSGFPKSHNLPGGLGTALKPAWEPIVLARKPLTGTVAQNVAKYGTGALNIEKCRINLSSQPPDEDVCGLLFALGSPRDTGAAVPVQLPYFVQRICAALAACNSGHTAHEHNAAGRDVHTTEADVQAVQMLLSRLQSNVELYAGNWSEALSSQLGCQTCRRFGDEHFRSIKDAAQGGLQSLAGALADTCRWLYARTYSRGCPCSDHPSNSDALDLRAALLISLITLAKQQDTTYLAPRIDSTERLMTRKSERGIYGKFAHDEEPLIGGSTAGRWPANVCHDGGDEVLEAFAAFGSDKGQSGRLQVRNSDKFRNTFGAFAGTTEADFAPHDVKGTAARFFFSAKASRAERNMGCEDLPEQPLNWSSGGQNPGSFQAEGTKKAAQNNHPTVKPIALMQWLCRLVTPPSGTVLDPFLGSGTTAIAAAREGFPCIGIELSPDYLAIARRRIAGDAPLLTEVA